MLLTIEEFQRITGRLRSIVEAMSMPGLSDIEVEAPRLREVARPADF